MFDFHKNHKTLVLATFIGFVMLSFIVAVFPASQMQNVKPLPNQPFLTENEREGLHIYISEGCVACHTQQVRNIEMDNVWGNRPSIPSDYYYSKERMDFWRQSPSLLGSERTGPDLTNIGARQSSKDWHLLHLYNPRTVVGESVMPSYPWLFEIVDSNLVKDEDVVVNLPEEFATPSKTTVIAKKEVLQLVVYLQSLKQMELPDGEGGKFIPRSRQIHSEGLDGDLKSAALNGENLYKQTCAVCHQDNGKGVVGAFPPLAGSAIVTNEDPEMMIKIILQGYDARTEFASMQPFADQLSDAEIAAIATHERSSWGNNAPEVKEEDVKKIREFIANDLNP
ncbi:cbb3-type cytochrome c oxidase subunit II [Arenibacter sp. ARW7G5Y1]|uniref:cbb3-type cytochrome c oxidase subunit II n=1 Tax=Arenibacter sp. ARW7G5Y1 TaxID=2135619 RepID=UPI000D756618|nr:cbb3-type cytochrome c oxidase subunit II [Arenibacter sp. ARW7G5Y1]PXX31169.1 cytochrome c oxidase cbb3-type subunit 2 [Arenibacter sp. ARW7G5Y1]